MAELLKNIYNKKFFNKFIFSLEIVKPDFNRESFLNDIYDSQWESLELKQRMRHITIVMKKYLFENYTDTIELFLKLIPTLEKNGFKPDNLEFIFIPDIIEIYGLNNYNTSINAFEKITQFVTCEFAIRPFIIKYHKEMISQMLLWTKHKHYSVRRLSTEGCRPRLPWAISIPSLKKDPNPIIPILEQLKNDESETVRRSVANNLNDISKDNPDTVIILSKKWKGKTPEIDKLLKHACRTLLKQGNTEVMELFGFRETSMILINDFQIQTPKVKIGDYVSFSFKLENTSNIASKIRIEYGIYYQKANKTLSKKVFKISEKEYPGNSTTTISRKQSFKIITTRKFYQGQHQLSIIINGNEFDKHNFELI